MNKTVEKSDLTPDSNIEIWNKIYDSGSMLWYPAEALVRLVRRQEKDGGLIGTVLDHGCGSGNIAEFLIRSGHTVHCTDVSSSALSLLEARFRGAKLRTPTITLIDPIVDLSKQLPAYSHVIAWQSLCYCPKQIAIDNIRQLIAGLPRLGAFFLCLPTIQDTLYLNSEPLPDGSRRLRKDISHQIGAVVTVPQSQDELLSWCDGIEVKDIVDFGMRFAGELSHFNALYGVKS